MSTATMARPRAVAPTEEERRVLTALADPAVRFEPPARIAAHCRTTPAVVRGVFARLMAREWSLPATPVPPVRVVTAPAPAPARDNTSVASPPEARLPVTFARGPAPVRRSRSRVDRPEPARGPLLFGFVVPATDLLTAAEEIALARRRVAGDISARNELVERNLRLALHIARPFILRRPNDADDILASAARSLMRAADKFDPERGLRFSTYASPWIKQGVRQFLRDDAHLIRVPAYIHEEAAQQKRPDYAAAAKRAWSFQSVGYTGSDSADDFEVASDEVATGFDPDDRAVIATALGELGCRHREILARRFGLEDRDRQTLAEVGVVLGLTKEQVRQLQIEALTLIRASLAARGITRPADLL